MRGLRPIWIRDQHARDPDGHGLARMPVITSGTNNVTAYVGGYVTFPAVSATGTQPFAYQWYEG